MATESCSSSGFPSEVGLAPSGGETELGLGDPGLRDTGREAISESGWLAECASAFRSGPEFSV